MPSQNGNNAYLVEDVSPYDFAAIYNVLPLWTATTPIDGTGQTIAIAGTSDICIGQAGSPCNGSNDVATFRSTFGLPSGTPAPIVKAGVNGFDPGVCTDPGTEYQPAAVHN